jgi:hypothetical protein
LLDIFRRKLDELRICRDNRAVLVTLETVQERIDVPDVQLRLYWGNWDKTAHPELNVGNVNTLLNRLQGNKYRAVVSTDTQLIELSAKDVQQSCGRDCKFWNIASVNPTDGSVQVSNSLVSGRPEGTAMYDSELQDAPPAKFCMKNNELYNRCNSQADCAVAGTTCQSPTDVQWSRAAY